MDTMVVTEKQAFVKLVEDDQGEQHLENDETGKNGNKVNKLKLKKKMKYVLVRYEELPDYMKENEYILDFYRSEWPLVKAALSLFSWHNETINVWTHLIGFFMFLGLTLVHLKDVPEVANFLGYFSWYVPLRSAENFSSPIPGNQSSTGLTSFLGIDYNISPLHSNSAIRSPTLAPRWPFYIFMAGSMFCLLTSSCCHLLCCHSRKLNLFLARFDFFGITIMIVASFFPPIYYIFLCETHWQALYLSAISAFGAATAAVLLSPDYASASFRTYRALLFTAMGLSGLVPAVHATIVNWSNPHRSITLALESAMALSYLTGVAFYVSRVPEKWKPGRFDIAGHSHQIFHVFVIAGALAHYAAALVFLEYRDLVGCNVTL